MAGKKKTKTLTVGVRVTPDLYKWIKDVADAEGLTVGGVARRFLMLARKQRIAA